MNSKERTHLPRQTSLALTSEVHWEQFPRDVRERCRALVVELLTTLVQSQPAGEDDDDKR